MNDERLIVLVPLLLLGVWFSAVLWRALAAASSLAPVELALRAGRPSLTQLGIGALTNFFDTLGIGSFATTATLFRLRGREPVPDRVIPGTLNVGHALPTVAQALVYIAVIEVDWKTLLSMIASAVLGAFLGARVVASWPERTVRLGIGLALLAAVLLMLARMLGLLPAGGDAQGLFGVWLGVGMLGNFALGALMTLGIGLYAPCMILVALLGMSPKVAFPIMMGSCAFLMPIASLAFIRRGSYAPRAALGLTLGGVPAVLIAAYLVKELPLDAVRWLVVVVVAYTATSFLRAAARAR
jgi:uncharacterized membrane protein YfcA